MIDKDGYRLIERSTESIGVVFNAARAPLASWGYITRTWTERQNSRGS